MHTRPQRFPRWMWRNTSVAAFADWLRAHNATLPDPSQAAGFYGMDLYRCGAGVGGGQGVRVDALEPRYGSSCPPSLIATAPT
jgi:erythromycin esterase-like protein